MIPVKSQPTKTIHRATRHRSALPGLELISCCSNESFPRHSHNEFGLGVIRQGSHRSWSGIGWVEAHAGDSIMVNPGEIHDGASVGGVARAWEMIYFDPQALAEALREETQQSFESICPAAADPVLAGCFNGLFHALTHPAPEGLVCEERLTELLDHLLRRCAARPQRRLTVKPCLAAARERLEDAPASPVTLAELAASCGVSRFHFLRAFRAAYGITPHAYLLQRRVLRAKELLSLGCSPAAAAAEAGFADQSHLTRCFVRQFGMPPGRWAGTIH